MTIHPTIRYTDADAAIAFLTSTLGLVEQQVNRDDDGRITHSELSHDDDVVMIGSRTDPPGEFDTGRAVIYLAVDPAVESVDAHHDRAVAAGAEIVTGLVDQPYGSREYTLRDPEGNIWAVGTYRPAPQTVHQTVES